jgi:hypothetical protein
MVDIETRRVVDSEIVYKVNASGGSSYEGISNGTEVETMR